MHTYQSSKWLIYSPGLNVCSLKSHRRHSTPFKAIKVYFIHSASKKSAILQTPFCCISYGKTSVSHWHGFGFSVVSFTTFTDSQQCGDIFSFSSLEMQLHLTHFIELAKCFWQLIGHSAQDWNHAGWISLALSHKTTSYFKTSKTWGMKLKGF